jgi:hypothetical protein
MREPRFGVLTIVGREETPGYVIFDRVTGRIVNGVYFDKYAALEIARTYSPEHGREFMTPSSEALALSFPY